MDFAAIIDGVENFAAYVGELASVIGHVSGSVGSSITNKPAPALIFWEFRVVNLLRAHRALGDDDFDALADYLEATAKHGHRRRDATVHQAARMAEMVLDIYPGSRKPDSVRARAIDIACKQMERETGEVVESERVRDLLNRPKRRRSQP
jgi:hypothetical protein